MGVFVNGMFISNLYNYKDLYVDEDGNIYDTKTVSYGLNSVESPDVIYDEATTLHISRKIIYGKRGVCAVDIIKQLNGVNEPYEVIIYNNYAHMSIYKTENPIMDVYVQDDNIYIVMSGRVVRIDIVGNDANPEMSLVENTTVKSIIDNCVIKVYMGTVYISEFGNPLKAITISDELYQLSKGARIFSTENGLMQLYLKDNEILARYIIGGRNNEF